MSCALQADEPNAGALDITAGRRGLWSRGGEMCALLQVRGADGGVLAQGCSTFVAPAPRPFRTEGVLSTLAEAHPQACNAAERGEQCGAAEAGFSEVLRHEWDLLACSQPRAPLRVLEVRGARWEGGRFEVWLGDAGMRAVRGFIESVGDGSDEEGVDGAGIEVGMLRVLAGPMPESLWCAEGGEGEGGAGRWGAGGGGLVGYLPVGVTTGSVDHLG